jgi:acyl-CoA synthetase (NDP forming)
LAERAAEILGPQARMDEAVGVVGAAHASGRRRLFEHEVYRIIESAGAGATPRHVFVCTDRAAPEDLLGVFPGDRVVLKIVSADVVHKSDAAGVVFCAKRHEVVTGEIGRLIALHRGRGARVAGVLVVEHVEHGQALGGELFVGLRTTREFGPVLAAGLGGMDTEFLAGVMRTERGVARALVMDSSAEEFFALFRRTAAYELISGAVRGHRRVATDEALVRCFGGFVELAKRLCVGGGEGSIGLAELEVNPFACAGDRLIALDGRGTLGRPPHAPRARPEEGIRRLIDPASMAVVGVSGQGENFGRIILRNVLASGFDRDRLHVVKEGHAEIDGVRCVPTVAALPGVTDVLVVAVSAEHVPEIVEQCERSRRVRSVIVIPGGTGETEGSGDILRRVREAVARAREEPGGGPVVLGPNCLGVQSRPGRYDTFFIPEEKLDKRRGAAGRGVALLSQSGAFILSRLSNLENLDARLTVSLGNQVDVTIGDLVRAAGERDDIHTLGVYVEGFNDLDGLGTVRAVRRIAERGKTVVFYKAGRTEQGRSAAAGHTASIAGDYDVCAAGAANAGALVATTLGEFERLLELSTALHGKAVRGVRLGAITNAGCEAVAIADHVRGPGYAVELAPLSPVGRERLAAVLHRCGLTTLVNARNPLDLTPMAGEVAYEEAARVMLGLPEIDALLISALPLTPALATTDEELAARNSLAQVLGRLARESDKPVVAVVDAGSACGGLVQRIREEGVPVLGRVDLAVQSLGRYLCHRVARRGGGSGVRC